MTHRRGWRWLVAKIVASELLETGLCVKQKRNGIRRTHPLEKNSVKYIQPVSPVIGVGCTKLLYGIDHRISHTKIHTTCLGKQGFDLLETHSRLEKRWAAFILHGNLNMLDLQMALGKIG